MLKLYYSKGTSALAAHILLEEVGAHYEVEEISIPNGAHTSPEYLAINPKGRIPALQTSEGVLSENAAILEYIAAVHPAANLIPDEPFLQAKARSLCSYLAATVHTAFAHKQRGARWADDPKAIAAMQSKVPTNIEESARLIEQHYIEGPWALGDTYSYCDPHLFLMGRWVAASDFSLAPFAKLSAHNAAMRARPATMTVLQAHGLA